MGSASSSRTLGFLADADNVCVERPRFEDYGWTDVRIPCRGLVVRNIPHKYICFVGILRKEFRGLRILSLKDRLGVLECAAKEAARQTTRRVGPAERPILCETKIAKGVRRNLKEAQELEKCRRAWKSAAADFQYRRRFSNSWA
jgi:hypothetical protein